jgi:BirA family transcriptional regulator, biotin operon repressor / biotin---[acetyl-CoA-carboxylase] ligase
LDRANPYASVARALSGTPFSRILYLESTESTNDDAGAILGDDGALGTTIVAEEQRRGAGRKGRAWIAAPQSALLFTTTLPREIPTADLWCLPFWVALCVRDALRSLGVPCELQWPNDILAGGRKLAGILCTSRIIADRSRAGCGVGINVRRFPEARDAITPEPAFCDDIAPVERPALLLRILSRFTVRLPLLDVPDEIARRWEREAGVPGRRYRLQRDDENQPFEGTAIALEPGGVLVVERAGLRERISLADARVLRERA